jgi:pantetheine-phosphate adenylyltransferase
VPERIAIYPGSFDPVTYGHVDIARRALMLFDRVVVAVAENLDKRGLLPIPERMRLLRAAFRGERRVEVDRFRGLLADYCRRRGARIVIRGLRAVADFEFEYQLAHMNRRLLPGLDTVFLMTGHDHFYTSSNLVKEVATLGGDVSGLVPEPVIQALRRRRRKGAR